MKTKYVTKKINYDGSQLNSLFAYKTFELLGPSMVSFRGACSVSNEHMVDAEDLIAKQTIASKDMLHFIVEIFDGSLLTAVSLQRLLSSIVKDCIQQLLPANTNFRMWREGDDLYVQLKGKKKLSISIASCSAVSSMIHFAVNISNEGTPVPTASLADLKVSHQKLAELVMKTFAREYTTIVEATQKVKPLSSF